MPSRATITLTLFAVVAAACTSIDGANDELTRSESAVPTLADHHVIAAYYADKHRDAGGWSGLPLCPNQPWVGSPTFAYPALGLYGNSTPDDRDVLRFDFEAMRNAGIDVVNVHIFPVIDAGGNVQLDLPQNGISAAQTMGLVADVAQQVGIMWTPTIDDGPGTAFTATHASRA